jgi:glycosyltransferase involved in cell wall biosynthesis
MKFHCTPIADYDNSLVTVNSGEIANISVIIPIWRGGNALVQLVRDLRSWPQVREIIVSAAESVFDLRRQLEKAGAIFLDNVKPNRGQQLNRGARIATGEWLLFQHADTELRREHIEALAALNGTDAVGGAFYRAFDERHPHLRFLEPLERWHSRTFGTIYGDQSIFVRRKHFLSVGGCAAIPLMEDVDFSQRLRASGKIKLLDPPIRSCARTQIAQGPWRVTLRNLLFLILFRCGVPVESLHRWYYRFRRESGERRSLFPASSLCRPSRAADRREN